MFQTAAISTGKSFSYLVILEKYKKIQSEMIIIFSPRNLNDDISLNGNLQKVTILNGDELERNFSGST
jgi:hypothetical protein